MNRTCRLCISLLCFFICFLLAMSGVRAQDEALAADLAPKILRFHVLANSDSAKDQALKLRVKDLLLEKIRNEAAKNALSDKEALKTYIRSESSTLEASAEDFIHSLGYDYGVHVEIGTSRFPVRTYGDMTFPAGTYETVRVTIGSGAGHNFWCVLYPSLCYTDSIHASMPAESKATLKDLIPEDDFQALINARPAYIHQNKKSEQELSSLPTVNIRFRIAELFSGN